MIILLKASSIITGENKDNLNRNLNDMSAIDLPMLCFGDAQAKSSTSTVQSILVGIEIILISVNEIITRDGFVNFYIFLLKTDKMALFQNSVRFVFTTGSIEVIIYSQPVINIFIIFLTNGM